jgi:hypothetical protein
MFEDMKDRKARLGFVWIRSADTGTTYLCPASHEKQLRSAADAELREFGVDESLNPQND